MSASDLSDIAESEESSISQSESDFSDVENEPDSVELSGRAATTRHEDDEEENEFLPYQDEPIADEEWLANYNARQAAKRELEEELTKRLDGLTIDVREWCKCGNCKLAHLQNISECYCCAELDGCKEAMESDIVAEDLQPGQVLQCITEHPGFRPVCLQKWVLRMAAQKYNTKLHQKYRQTGTEEKFLRAVAYREFSRLVYGFLGKKRIPLPACCYSAIREAFAAKAKEDYTGFDLGDEDSDAS